MYMYIYSFLLQLNIHKFKCVARFGLMHIVATNICVWIRTMFKESNKEIAIYRVDRGQGVSEDYMILGRNIVSLIPSFFEIFKLQYLHYIFSKHDINTFITAMSICIFSINMRNNYVRLEEIRCMVYYIKQYLK